jgi:hypothetical protein
MCTYTRGYGIHIDVLALGALNLECDFVVRCIWVGLLKPLKGLAVCFLSVE